MNPFERTMAGLEASLQVAHVATTPLRVAYPKDTVAAVRAWAAAEAINNVPVRRDGRIVAVIENINGDLPPARDGVPPARPQDHQRVDEVMRRLSSDMLIEGRQPLVQLIDELLEPPHYRLMIDGGRLDAIVTPSDLGKLPMRVLAYTSIAHLEATMTEAIRRCYPNDEDAVAELGDGAQAQILGDLERMHDKDLAPSLLEVANLEQKGLILTAADAFRGEPDAVASEFKDLYEKLRNPLMHAASFVDDSLAALSRLKRQLSLIHDRTVEATAAPLPGRSMT
jgi:hypothetical protein